MSLTADKITHNKETIGLIPTNTGVYLTVHGHFYQPPRENPYLNTIERQPSAYPFHDWNERIHQECYRPNAFARILNDHNEVIDIVNNYEYISFNIGATLMSWIEKHDIEVYQRILEGDRKSCEKLNGHGNAIAQVYNHIIMPLANEKDKYTQIRWGKADFKARFQREPEGMWLAETAVDYETLQALIAENIRFIILAPSQAQRCRAIPTTENPDPQWLQVGGAQIDPTRPYRCFLDQKRYIDIFFYDGPISRDMGFSELLASSPNFLGRLSQAVRGDHRPSQLISVATDGETFGHHKKGTEKTLAYALTVEFPQRGWIVTNFAHYLSLNPPTQEVELKPVTAWSCAHGVDRWQDDCGCGGGGSWHQKWRKPLRHSLNWLRDRLSQVYQDAGSKLFNSPWRARDQYIEVVLDRSPESTEAFLSRHQSHQLNPVEQIDALRLLEMQRHALLMFTSCGWFFEEISRPEGVQILRYAARAMELAAETTGENLEKQFISHLSKAASNIESFVNGAEVYRQLVSQISLEKVAAHYAISSLFKSYQQQERVYCYDAYQLDYQKQKMGVLTLAVGQVRLVSEITWENQDFIFAVLHLGGWDFHCCIQPFSGRSVYSQLKEDLFKVLKQASGAKMILEMVKMFGDQSFDLQDLFPEDRHRIMQQLAEKTKIGVQELYSQVYRDNYGILVAFQREELPVPLELQVAAEIALSDRILTNVQALEQVSDNQQLTQHCLMELKAIAAEANHLRCQLKIPQVKDILSDLILCRLWQLLNGSDSRNLEADIQTIDQIIELGFDLNLDLSLAKAQEIYYHYLQTKILVNTLDITSRHTIWTVSEVCQILALGQKLGIDVAYWLNLTGE